MNEVNLQEGDSVWFCSKKRSIDRCIVTITTKTSTGFIVTFSNGKEENVAPEELFELQPKGLGWTEEHITDGFYSYGHSKESHDDLVKRIRDWEKSKWERDSAFRKQLEFLEDRVKNQFLSKLEDHFRGFCYDREKETITYLRKLARLEDSMKES